MARVRLTFALLAAVALTLAAGGCFGGDDEQATSTDSAVCGYLYEWTSIWRIPLQPDPHAAYSYVIPKVTSDPIGFLITGPFPHAAWTSWDIYDSKFNAVAVASDSAIKPDAGSVNPFVEGTPVLSKKRSFTLLVVPRGTDKDAIAASLRHIPASNRISSPASGKFFLVANRVYNAFPGYDRGGAGGPTDSPFPQVKAINYKTGEGVDCSKYNLLPSPKPPTETPTTATTESPPPALIELADGTRASVGLQVPDRGSSSGNGGLRGAQFAPELDPDRIELTRPPLLPGADVSSVPPPDNCSGYLGAATSTTKIGLIRMPHVARWFETENLTPKTPFKQEQASYISFTQYGSAISVYDPGSPITGSLGDGELKVDSSGGSTIVIWPRSLSAAEQKEVFAYADREGWAIMRGGEKGPVTTANMFIRLKGSDPSYQGGYTPTAEREGVPCYYDDHPKAKRWSDLTGQKYVASAKNIGPGAPQGVHCTVAEFLGGSCLASLKAYIAETGGSYTAH